MPSKEQRLATSRYRQLRITATHEVSGRFSYSVYAKPLNKEWHEHQCMARGSTDGTTLHLHSTEDVIAALITILEGYLLPGLDEVTAKRNERR